MDYYKILNITKSASEEEVKKAYRKLAHKHHPDRAGGDEKKFKEINEAYQTLSNKEKRAQYDRFGQAFNGAGGGSHGHQGFGFGGFSSGAGFNPEDLGDLSDIFETFFGGSRRRRTYTHGNDLQIAQEITLEEAYRGVTKELKFQSFDTCAECVGLGHEKDSGTKKCETCDGRGEIREVRKSFFGSIQQVRACEKCSGIGEIPNKVCQTCKGSGRLQATRTVKVQIAPGVSDGQLIKVTGAGEVGERGASAGDLYVQVRVKPHSVFRRQDDDLYVKKDLNIVLALRAGSVEVQTISGEPTTIQIPAGANLSERFKVAGKGMPHLHTRGFGDMYAQFDVHAPNKLTNKAKKLLDDLSEELS